MTETHRVRDLAEMVAEHDRRRDRLAAQSAQGSGRERSRRQERQVPRPRPRPDHAARAGCSARSSMSRRNTPTASTAPACPPSPPGRRTSPARVEHDPEGKRLKIGLTGGRLSDLPARPPPGRARLRDARHQRRLRCSAPTALVRSLALTGTTADIVVLHTAGVAADDLAPLAALGCRLVRVRPSADLRRLQRAPMPARALHARGALHQGRQAGLPHAARQFRQAAALAAADYERVVFIDADTLVLTQHRPAVRLSGVLRRTERLREPRPTSTG